MISLDKIVSVIHEKTAIPIGIGVLIGYILVWAVHTGDDVVAHASRLAKVEATQEAYTANLQKINTHLAIIERTLKIKKHEIEE